MNSAGRLPEDHSIPLLESESDPGVSHNVRRSHSSSTLHPGAFKVPLLVKPSFAGVARHTLGILLLLATVVLWTASNFLASVSFLEMKGSLHY